MTTIAASTVVTPAGILAPGQVTVEHGVIVDVRAGRGAAPDRILCPGFVDLQVNGHDDIHVATAEGDDWERLDETLLAQGVTAWCPTLITAPLDSFAAPLERIAVAAARPDSTDRPAILGAHLEGPFLGGAPGAHPVEHLRGFDRAWIDALPEIVRVVTLAPELDGASEVIAAFVQRGVLVSLGHSTATYEECMAATDAGARLVTHLFNGMSPLHHRRPGLVGAALTDDRLVPSLIADGVHVHPAALRTAARAKGYGRWVLVTDSVGWRDARLGPRGDGRRCAAPGGWHDRRLGADDGLSRRPHGPRCRDQPDRHDPRGGHDAGAATRARRDARHDRAGLARRPRRARFRDTHRPPDLGGGGLRGNWSGSADHVDLVGVPVDVWAAAAVCIGGRSGDNGRGGQREQRSDQGT